jgi:hypothetical protein
MNGKQKISIGFVVTLVALLGAAVGWGGALYALKTGHKVAYSAEERSLQNREDIIGVKNELRMVNFKLGLLLHKFGIEHADE